jgi:hypothetical protein
MKESSGCNPLDSRRFPRYPCSNAADISRGGRLWGQGTVSDVSASGCYVETFHPLPVGEEVQLQFTIEDILLDISGNVVSSDPMFGMAVEFLSVPTEQWNKLPEVIETATVSQLSPAVLASHQEAQASVQAALLHLQQAQKKLQKSMYDMGIQCTRGLQFTEKAISEVKNARERRSTSKTFDPASMGSGLVLRDELFEQWLISGL